jgi:hypothetical protein
VFAQAYAATYEVFAEASKAPLGLAAFKKGAELARGEKSDVPEAQRQLFYGAFKRLSAKDRKAAADWLVENEYFASYKALRSHV